MTFLYKADPARGAEWARLFAERAPELPFRLWPDIGDPAAVRYLAAWEPPDDLAQRFSNLDILFSVGAGVDQFDVSRLPPDLPVWIDAAVMTRERIVLGGGSRSWKVIAPPSILLTLPGAEVLVGLANPAPPRDGAPPAA